MVTRIDMWRHVCVWMPVSINGDNVQVNVCIFVRICNSIQLGGITHKQAEQVVLPRQSWPARPCPNWHARHWLLQIIFKYWSWDELTVTASVPWLAGVPMPGLWSSTLTQLDIMSPQPLYLGPYSDSELQVRNTTCKLDRIWTWLIKSRPLESESVCIDPAAVKASGLLLEYQTTSKACSCARHSKGSQLASTLVFESAPGQHPSWPLCLGERGSPGRRSRLVWLPTASAEPVLATCCLLADRNGPLCQGILSSWRNATGSTG